MTNSVIWTKNELFFKKEQKMFEKAIAVSKIIRIFAP